MCALSLGQARRIALAAQGFTDPEPKGRVDRRHLRRVMGRIRLLQLDAVPVVIRTQYLPLFSRLGPYDLSLLDRMAYRDDEWFEAWTHEASLVPVELEPSLRWLKDRAAAGHTWKGIYDFARENAAYVDAVRQQVAEEGPLRAGELHDPRPKAGEWWAGRSDGRRALDWLFRIGEVGIRRTSSFEKVWDLTDRIVPTEVRCAPTPTHDQAHRELLMHSARAHGVGTASDLADYFRLPIVSSRLRLAELVEDQQLVPVVVEGWRHPAFLHPEAVLPRRIRRTALLSPFDPVVWHRDRARRLFDFDYKIEIYTPKAERKYGYYVLPFLMGEHLVARVDLKTDRDAGVLRVLAIAFEDGHDRGEVEHHLAPAFRRLAELVGVEEVAWHRTGPTAK